MEKELIRKAFMTLYPDKEFTYDAKIRYSGKFKGYNANVKLNRFSDELIFSLSREWKDISDEIKIGLIQELMVKIIDRKNHMTTLNMEMYDSFLKNVHVAAPRIDSEPYLLEAFQRVNERYFFGMMDMPNLRWGQDSFRKLGSYHYSSDTITISRILQDAPLNLLDYVVYHELLHKKHKYTTKNGRSFHHTKEFKEQERLFEDQEKTEKELNRYVQKTARGKVFSPRSPGNKNKSFRRKFIENLFGF